MELQLISFDTAKLSKLKGFEQKNIDEHYLVTGVLDTSGLAFINGLSLGSAPTQPLLQNWLRGLKTPIVLEVNFGVIDDSTSAYTWHIRKYVPEGVEGTRKKDEWDFWNNYDSFTSPSGNWFETYEYALEEGLKQALNLINV